MARGHHRSVKRRSSARWGIALLIHVLAACGGPTEAPPVRPATVASTLESTASSPPTTDEPTPSGAPTPAEASAPTCTDEPRARRAVATTLSHAVDEGALSEAVASGCVFERAACDGEALPADPARCVVDVRTDDALWHVRVTPAAIQDAPRWLEATLEPSAALPPLRLSTSASTWAVHGSLAVGGVDSDVSHTHGGRAASIGSAEFLVRNGSRDAVHLRVAEVTWLTSAGCTIPLAVRATPPVRGVSLGRTASVEAEVVLPPGESRVFVRFEPQDAYYAYCDRFAARASLLLDGARLTATSEWIVTSRMPRSAH